MNPAHTARRQPHAFAAILLAGLLAGTSGLHADDGALPQDQAREFLQRRLDRSALPGDARLERRLSGTAADGTVPVLVKPEGGQAANFETSISQWTSWLAARDQKIIEEARTLAPEGVELKAPRQTKAASEIDVWTRGSLAPSSDLGELYTSSVGADVKLDSRLVLGAMVQMDRAKESGTGAVADGEAYLAGPYLGLRLTDHITAGLTTAWGQGHDVIASGSDAYALDTSRRITEAKLKGDWAVNEWRIAPVATFNLREEAASGEGAAATVGTRSLSVGPEVSRPISLEDGTKLEPFARVNGNLDLNALPEAPGSASALSDAATTGVGAGFTLSRPDEYTLRATTDLEGLGSDSDEVKARLQLSVPLK